MGLVKKAANKLIVQPAKNKARELVEPGRVAAGNARDTAKRKAMLRAGKCPDNPPTNKHQFQGRNGDLTCRHCEAPFRR